MGYANPLLATPAAKRLLALPKEQREPVIELLNDLRLDANERAEVAWRRRKGVQAAYWRAVSTYARHIAHALKQGLRA